MIFDDGRATYLAWPEGQPIPVILALAPDGKEAGPVNTSLSGPYVVVENERDTLILQAGKKQARLVNIAPPALPPLPAPEALTTIPAAASASQP
jgi:type IV secretion system protein VirB9